MPPVVAIVKAAGTPVPVPVKSKVPSPPSVVLLIESEAFSVFVYVQAGASPPVMTARTVVSPGSNPAVAPWAKVPPMPVPIVITAPLAAHTMFVSVQPGSGVSWTSLVPSWKPVRANGALAVGLATAVLRVKGARPEPLTAKSKVPVPPTLCFSMSSEAFWVFVYVQVTASPGSRAMLARPVATLVVPFEQARLVRSQPGTGRVSWIVLVPVAAAPTKVKVRVFGVPDAGSSSRMKLPLWKVVPPPVPVVVKAKSWAAVRHGVLGDRDGGVRGVRVRAGRGVPGREDRAHGGVARIKPGRGALGEARAAAGADGDDRAVGGAGDVRERPAGLGGLHRRPWCRTGGR